MASRPAPRWGGAGPGLALGLPGRRRAAAPTPAALLAGGVVVLVLVGAVVLAGLRWSPGAPAAAAGAGQAGATGEQAARGAGQVDAPAVDPAAVGANELGQVPVLMYHQLVTKPAGVYDRTPAQFRAELERLAQEKYVPVTASAYARGELDLPAGTSPVVLTFDDATRSQLTLGPDGEPLPDTAVGILLDVARQNPGFKPVATFYVNADPFAEPGGTRTLRWLHQHGFELGNHTRTHALLRSLPAAAVQREIAGDLAMISTAVPDAVVDTFALPFGVHPTDKSLARTGSADGISYQHRAVFLVGYKPAPSPYAADWDADGVPRIRSQGKDGKEAQFGSTGWLDQLARKPGMRFVSDGNPARVSFPRSADEQLAPALRARANPY